MGLLWKNTDLTSERRRMVECHLKGRGIRDERVLRAFDSVPRERFISPDMLHQAYDDHPIPIGHGQTISQPYMVALMTQMLLLSGRERVLEIGTGSGYQTAILAELAREVYSVERIALLSEGADETLRDLGYANIRLRVGDGTMGWPEEAPFDRVLVTAGAPKVPAPLTDQLAEGGRLVVPVGDSYSQMIVLVEKKGGKLSEQRSTACVFVRLIGREGWPENEVE